MHENLSKIVRGPEAQVAVKVTSPAPWDTQPYSTKRDGLNIINCDDEPVRTPGCIQAHGALLVLRRADLSVLQASENTGAILGQAASSLLGQSVAAIVKTEGETRLRSILTTEPTDCNPIYAFTLPAGGQAAAMDVTLHTLDGVVMLEFEATGRGQPGTGTGPVAPGPRDEPDYYSIIKKTVARLQAMDTVQTFCQALADEVRLLSGMDRVMIHKFHADHHGEN